MAAKHLYQDTYFVNSVEDIAQVWRGILKARFPHNYQTNTGFTIVEPKFPTVMRVNVKRGIIQFAGMCRFSVEYEDPEKYIKARTKIANSNLEKVAAVVEALQGIKK